MMRVVLSAISIAALAFALPAAAQDKPIGLEQSGGSPVGADYYATCLVAHNSRKVSRALDSGFGAPFDAAVSILPGSGCLKSGEIAPATSALRGPLFAAMYRKFGARAGRSASNLITNWVPSLPTGDPKIGWYAVSACLVGKAPSETREVVRAAPGSEAMTRHLNAILPDLQGCLPGGQQFAFKRPVLIGLLAETIYRIDFAVGPGERNNF